MTHEMRLKNYDAYNAEGLLSLGTRGSYGVESFHIIREDVWAEYAVSATFHTPKGDAVQVRVSADDTFAVPQEVTAQSGVGRLVFAGYKDGVQQITHTVLYRVTESCAAEGTAPAEPTPSLVQQVLSAAENAEKAAKDALETLTKSTVLDTTLSHAGEAADAKAVGDALKTTVSTDAQTLSKAQMEQARRNIQAESYGTWALLESVTTEEDMLSFERTAEPDGTAYDLRAIKVIVKTPGGQKAGLYDWSAYCKDEYGYWVRHINGVCTCLGNTFEPATGYVVTAIFEAVPQFGVYKVVSAYGTQGDTMTLVYPSNGNYQTVSAEQHIKRFGFKIYDNVPLLKGSKVEIWGVRA